MSFHGVHQDEGILMLLLKEEGSRENTLTVKRRRDVYSFLRGTTVRVKAASAPCILAALRGIETRRDFFGASRSGQASDTNSRCTTV